MSYATGMKALRSINNLDKKEMLVLYETVSEKRTVLKQVCKTLPQLLQWTLY
jgi:hypothetical protein